MHIFVFSLSVWLHAEVTEIHVRIYLKNHTDLLYIMWMRFEWDECFQILSVGYVDKGEILFCYSFFILRPDL